MKIRKLPFDRKAQVRERAIYAAFGKIATFMATEMIEMFDPVKFKSGGLIKSSGCYVVGERGPEALFPSAQHGIVGLRQPKGGWPHYPKPSGSEPKPGPISITVTVGGQPNEP